MKYNVAATVTISLSAVVEADSEEEALEKAHRLAMPNITDDAEIQRDDDGNWESWATSGELDGEPVNILTA